MTEETSFTVIKITEVAFLIYTIRLHDISHVCMCLQIQYIHSPQIF